MKSLDLSIVITPTRILPYQRGRGIPGFPDENQRRVKGSAIIVPGEGVFVF
jgi:hypothetical protein